VDLEEAIGSVESTKAVYDKMLELKIANAQVNTPITSIKLFTDIILGNRELCELFGRQ
jgi:hypothetical protein